MTDWSEFTHYAGLDWGRERHHLVVLDNTGQVALRQWYEDTPEGWKKLLAATQRFQPLPIALETSRGLLVDRLLLEFTVFPVPPQNAKRYRERHVCSGAKDDFLDAHSLSDALRVDGHAWDALQPDEPQTQKLRILCEDHIYAIRERTRLGLRLEATLREYYPTASRAFDSCTEPCTWAFVARFPTPQQLIDAGQGAWTKFLHANRMAKPKTYQERMDCFAQAAEEMSVDEAKVEAYKCRALALIEHLKLLQKQIHAYEKSIEDCFETHPDAELFKSLPMPKTKTPHAARLLTCLGDHRERFSSFSAVQCYAGTAPVTRRSGKYLNVQMRRACNKYFRNVLSLWANETRRYCPWAQQHYRRQRDRGRGHAAALRALANRWLKFIWTMWQRREKYDPELHMRNQIKHGSWIIQLQVPNPNEPAQRA